MAGNPNADMAARTRVNATTTKLVNKKGGTILSTVTLVVELAIFHVKCARDAR